MERTVKIVLGDWSDDGHGKTESHVVRISGLDVSDEELNRNAREMGERTGTQLHLICEEYEDSSVDEDLYEALVQAGFAPPMPGHYTMGRSIHAASDSGDVYFPAIALVMFYVGHDIADFSWTVVSEDIPTLIGGSNTILQETSVYGEETHVSNITSFGYGLFF